LDLLTVALLSFLIAWLIHFSPTGYPPAAVSPLGETTAGGETTTKS
jgi:tetrahydromethanopterin S-methyltransferase subunit D